MLRQLQQLLGAYLNATALVRRFDSHAAAQKSVTVLAACAFIDTATRALFKPGESAMADLLEGRAAEAASTFTDLQKYHGQRLRLDLGTPRKPLESICGEWDVCTPEVAVCRARLVEHDRRQRALAQTPFFDVEFLDSMHRDDRLGAGSGTGSDDQAEGGGNEDADGEDSDGSSDDSDDSDDEGDAGGIAGLLGGGVSRRRDNPTLALAKTTPALEQVAVLARMCGLPDKGGIRRMHLFHYQSMAGLDEEDMFGRGQVSTEDLPASFSRQVYLLNALNDFNASASTEELVMEGRTDFTGDYRRCPEYTPMVTAALAARVACEPTYQSFVAEPSAGGVMHERQVFQVRLTNYDKNEQSVRAIVGIFQSKEPIHFYRQPRVRCTNPLAHGIRSRKPSSPPDEDDVVLARAVDDFDGALTEDHAERMLTFLCEPHVRIPLLLQFMSQEGSGALFNQEIRHLLWHAVFEGLTMPQPAGSGDSSGIASPNAGAATMAKPSDEAAAASGAGGSSGGAGDATVQKGDATDET